MLKSSEGNNASYKFTGLYLFSYIELFSELND